jgi:hypothetical protein
LIPKGPERLSVRPRSVTGTPDIPHRDHVVDPPKAMNEPVDPREPSRQIPALDLRFYPAEQGVDGLEVAVLG